MNYETGEFCSWFLVLGSLFLRTGGRTWFLMPGSLFLNSLFLVPCFLDPRGGGVVNAEVNAGEAEREALGGKRGTGT